MDDFRKTKTQLIYELNRLRQKITDLTCTNPAMESNSNVGENSIKSQEPSQNFFDQTHYEQIVEENQTTIQLLDLIHTATEKTELIHGITRLLSEYLGCEAVGIRLRDGDDYPYFETRGFSEEFVLAENSLCVVDSFGEVLRESDGNPVLECMCGNVIYGRFDPAKPFFTKFGSFWTNSTTEMLASTTEEERQSRTRNRCNREGYESVALIPLKTSVMRIGLIQINDSRKNYFRPEHISFLEKSANYLSIALSHIHTQEKITFDLKEKEVLLREIHHRVKNNMQLITSLLHLQSLKITNEETRKIFQDSQQRIRAMSYIHETLYRSEQVGMIDFKDFIQKMVTVLYRAYGLNSDRIQCEIVVDAIHLFVDDITPVALIINELLTNSYKHAFPDGRPGKIEICIHQEKSTFVKLTVRDNGIGLPAHKMLKNNNTLGLQLLYDLAEGQLGGSLTINRSNGTEIIVSFKSKHHRN